MAPTRRNEYGKSAHRKAEILDATLELIDASGHETLTVAAVASHMRMPLPTVIYHFPTRAHLLAAALMAIDAQNFEAEQAAFIAHQADGVPIEIVAEHLSRMGMAAPNRMRLRAHLWAEALVADHPANGYLRSETDKGVEALQRFLHSQQAAGLAHPDLDPERAARRILATWEGLQLLWLRDPKFDLAAEMHVAIRQLTGQDVMDARQIMEEAIRAM